MHHLELSASEGYILANTRNDISETSGDSDKSSSHTMSDVEALLHTRTHMQVQTWRTRMTHTSSYVDATSY